jgi:signal transduction histidine kinase
LAVVVAAVTVAWIATAERTQAPEGARTDLDALAVMLVAAACVPLLWRRRAPIEGLVVIAAATTTWALRDYPGELIVPLTVAAYTASARGEPRSVAAVALPATLAASVAITLSAPEAIGSWVEGLVGVVAATGLPILLGQVVASRRRWVERDRQEIAREAVAKERSRIARELHDVVTHAMGIMVVQAGAGRRVLGRDRAEAEGAFRRIEEIGRTGLAEMRRLLGFLETDEAGTRRPQPGLDQLDELVESVRGAGLSVDVTVEGLARPLPPGIDLTAYRIVQEALTNTLRHAGRARAEVLLRYGDDALVVQVLDDGRGPPSGGPPGPGRGLIGMHERISLFAGSLQAGPRPAGGFLVRATIPLAER